jgi:hypothetical protein
MKFDGPAKSIFSRQDAKTAKKNFVNINNLPLRALHLARGFDFLRMCQT